MNENCCLLYNHLIVLVLSMQLCYIRMCETYAILPKCWIVLREHKNFEVH